MAKFVEYIKESADDLLNKVSWPTWSELQSSFRADAVCATPPRGAPLGILARRTFVAIAEIHPGAPSRALILARSDVGRLLEGILAAWACFAGTAALRNHLGVVRARRAVRAGERSRFEFLPSSTRAGVRFLFLARARG